MTNTVPRRASAAGLPLEDGIPTRRASPGYYPPSIVDFATPTCEMKHQKVMENSNGWQGDYVIADMGSFDLEKRLEESLGREPSGDDFCLSPLTSVESTPESSPDVQTIGLPEVTIANKRSEPPVCVDAPTKPPKSERIKRRNREQSRKNQRKRLRLEKQSGREGPELRVKAEEKYRSGAKRMLTPLATSTLPTVRSGYLALNRPMADAYMRAKEAGTEVQKEFTLEELLVERKFKYLEWDGKIVILVFDGEDQKRVIAILAGHPDGWDNINPEAMKCLKEARERIGAKPSKSERRGAFSTLCTGFSYGGGRTEPMNFKNDGVRREVVDDLNEQPCFRRVAGFQSSVFRTWAPELYEYYDDKLGQVVTNNPSLKKSFRSVFPAATYNLGPQTVCIPHLDFANLPYGYCAITAFGDYDPKKGGHIVLWESKLVIEFPPGSMILIPSAIVTHFNQRVADTETRYSFTQYAAGGLFRWADNGFMTANNQWQKLNAREREKKSEEDGKRWEMGLELLPRMM